MPGHLPVSEGSSYKAGVALSGKNSVVRRFVTMRTPSPEGGDEKPPPRGPGRVGRRKMSPAEWNYSLSKSDPEREVLPGRLGRRSRG